MKPKFNEPKNQPGVGDLVTWNGHEAVWQHPRREKYTESLHDIGAPSNAAYIVVEADRNLLSDRVFTEGAGLDVVDGGAKSTYTVGLGGDTILLYDSGGSPVAEYAATSAGLASALTAIAAGDMLVFPRNIEIALTSALTISAAIIIRDMKLAFSGFSGVALTIASNAKLENCTVDYDGSGQASATAVKTTSQCKLTWMTAQAHDATTNVGLWALGSGHYERAHLVSCIGDARNGTTNIGIRLDDYSLAQNCLGSARNQSNGSSGTYIGMQFYGTQTNEDGPLAIACSGVADYGAVAYGAMALAGKRGRAIGCSFVGLNGTASYGLVIEATATLEFYACYYSSLSNSGTTTLLTGDRVPLDNYYTLSGVTATISGGTLTAAKFFTVAAAEVGAADDLDTITFGVAPKLIMLQADAGDTITVKHGTGNIQFSGAADFKLSGDKTLLLFFDGTNWSDVGAAIGKVLDGSNVANVANDQTTPGIPVVWAIAVAGGAAANEDITTVGKTRVIDVWCLHTGGAGEASDTIQIFNGANAITNAMDWSGADATVVRAATFDDAYTAIASGGTLRATTTDADAGDDVGAGIVYVLAIPVA